jgi:hypothetical protein
MTKLAWDQTTKRTYETGVSKGVLYVADGGTYPLGVAWNGLTTVTESPTGAESNKTYADNIPYLNLLSQEIFGATIEAYTFPSEFDVCDGIRSPVPGASIAQQPRKSFGFCYQTIKGNDTEGNEYGHKTHIVYGALASPSEKAYQTVNETPAPIDFSWAVSTTPVEVGTIDGVDYKPTSLLVFDSTVVDADALAALEDILYGTVSDDPRLPLPAEIMALFVGTITEVFPTAPTWSNGTHLVTIPAVTGVEYRVDGEVLTAGTHAEIADFVVNAYPLPGYIFSQPSDDDWFFEYV